MPTISIIMTKHEKMNKTKIIHFNKLVKRGGKVSFFFFLFNDKMMTNKADDDTVIEAAGKNREVAKDVSRW